MAEQQITQETSSHVDAPFRMDVKLHEILMEPKQAEKRTTLQPKGLTLPQPVSPQREYSHETDPTLTQYQKMNARRTWNAWGKRYFLSRSIKSRRSFGPSSPICSLTISATWIATTAGPTTIPSRGWMRTRRGVPSTGFTRSETAYWL